MYIRSDLSNDVKSFFSPEIESVFLDILLRNTKPKVVGITYRPPSQLEHFSKLDANNNEIYILGDFNINVYLKLMHFSKK